MIECCESVMNYLSDASGTTSGPRPEHQAFSTTEPFGGWDLSLYDKSSRGARFWVHPSLFVSILFFLGLFASPLWAQSDILWLVESGEEALASEVLDGVGEALGSEARAHLLGRKALLERVDGRTRPFSGCAFGLETCMSAEAMAFDALGISLVIRLEIQRRPTSLEVSYEMVDRRGSRADMGRLRGDTGRDVGFALVGELFDAVGILSFETDPPGATVFLGDEEVGTTPLSRQMGLGRHNYRLELEAHRTEEGHVDVRAGEAERVTRTMRKRPGRLAISGAPEGAIVLVDDQPSGRAGERIDLLPGEYTIEVQAEGYHPHREQVEIKVDETQNLEVSLVATNLLMREVARDEVLGLPFQFDLGVELGLQLGTFTNSSGRLDDQDYEFVGWLSQGELIDRGRQRRFLSPAGVRFGAGWEGARFGFTALSLSWLGETLDYPARIVDDEGRELDGRVQRYRTIELRPMQLRYRFFYENLVPLFQGGLGLSFQRIDFEVDGEESMIFRQISPFLALEAGVRYHITPAWSFGGAYRLSIHFSDSQSAKHHLGVFLGFGLPDLPGVNLQPPEAL